MLARYKQQVVEAEGKRRQAAARYANSRDRWRFHKKHFFTNPTNLLLPFTAGALLASRGSATRQMVGWGRVLFTGSKIIMATYPFIRTVNKTAAKVARSNDITEPQSSSNSHLL